MIITLVLFSHMIVISAAVKVAIEPIYFPCKSRNQFLFISKIAPLGAVINLIKINLFLYIYIYYKYAFGLNVFFITFMLKDSDP